MKEQRQNRIKEIIESKDIETQDELLEELKKEGFKITQATISRDMREMKLTKVLGESGKQKYAMLKNFDTGVEQKYKKVLSAGIVSIDHSDNLIVIKTVSGMAMAVAAALDNMDIPGLMGCIAGDDTIMCAIRSMDDTLIVMEKIKKLLNGENKGNEDGGE